MADAVVETPAVEKPFDVQEYMRTENEAQQAKRDGKPVPAQPAPKPTETAPPPAKEDGNAEDHPGMSARDRRRMNQLIRDAASANGRADALQALLDRGVKQEAAPAVAATPKADDEPKRDQFATEAEYVAAVGRWAARDETAKLKSQTSQQAAIEEMVAQSRVSYAEQSANIPDFDAIMEKADSLELNANQNAFVLFALSEFQAPITEHFVNNPEDFAKLMSYEDAIKAGDPNAIVAQTKLFNRIEGEANLLYKQRLKAKSAAPSRPSPGELDAKKARPSESITPRGGTATDGTIPMMLDNGKDINPAWMAAENLKNGVRP